MTFNIPIYIEERTDGEARTPVFVVRPLFHMEPVQRAEKLSRALTRLGNELRNVLRELGREPRHDGLAEWTFHPLLDPVTVELRLELGSGSTRRSFFLVGYEALDRRLYFCPSLPGLHFEVAPNQILAERATSVFTRRLREIEREQGSVDLDDYALCGKARLTTLEIEVQPTAVAKTPRPSTRALLFGSVEPPDGEQELRRTGRCLNAMYPDALDRAVGREQEVEDITRLLLGTDRRPVLLVGPHQVGKTAILHEVSWQAAARKKGGPGSEPELWLLSPLRLISGMSCLGEWENRVQAILNHARHRDLVLYFDDLLGLFGAGINSASNLNVAQVLRPCLEQRAVRVVAEITPEAWRVLRERDRAFADLFQVIPVHEPTERETLRMLVAIVRHLETEHGCTFDLEVIPTVLELHRRFARDAAFPGKAAGFLRRLAVRQAGLEITRAGALEEFHTRSGLQVALLDARVTYARADIVEQLRRGVLGQDPVLEAFADLVVCLKARLNDPGRPLGTFLLLGPTGVGKTQAARTLARFLFGNEARLVRFDMNEFGDGAAVTRLTGTPHAPEGLLTNAIRRQPFSVVLFDEIEKAAPEAFDLLLAVLDEGRLADALGRVADFTQSVILLTSNLGARESRSRLGFGAATGDAEGEDAVYVSAAEKFFRPEFFNRLDRILPFRALDRPQLEGIARQLLAGVLERDGLKRRNGIVNVSPAALERLVTLGHHPQLGARALKRVVEREVAQPVAVKLCALPPGAPMIANLSITGDVFTWELKALEPVARVVRWPEAAAAGETSLTAERKGQMLAEICAALDVLEKEIDRLAPSGRVELGQLTPEHTHYFICREHLKKIDRLVEAVERSSQRRTSNRAATRARVSRAKPVKLVLRQYDSGSPRLDRERAAIALQQDLEEMDPQPVDVPDSPLLALLRELALLEALALRPFDLRPVLVVFRSLSMAGSGLMFNLARSYAQGLGQIWGITTQPLFEHQEAEEVMLRMVFGEPCKRTQALYVSGLHVRRFLPETNATVLVQPADGQIGVVVMHLEPVASEADARDLARRLDEAIDTLEPAAFGPVVHLVTEKKGLTDYRSGLAVPSRPSAEEFRALLLSALPVSIADSVIRWVHEAIE